LQREGVFRLLKIKSHFEKPSERKKRETDENTRRVKKFKKLKARY
jgi:small subunit ribosomal protein S21